MRVCFLSAWHYAFKQNRFFIALLTQVDMNSIYFVYNPLIFSELKWECLGQKLSIKHYVSVGYSYRKTSRRANYSFTALMENCCFWWNQCCFLFSLAWTSNISWTQNNPSCSLSLASHWINSKLYILKDAVFVSSVPQEKKLNPIVQ